MPFWLTLGLFAFSFIATALLAPKPKFENAKAGTLGDFRFPRAQEGSPITLAWGRNRLRSPNVLWYGGLRADPIVERVKVSLFKKKNVIVGHRYYVTFDLALCIAGTADARLTRIWSGDNLLWEGDVGVGETDGVTINIDEPDLYGGYKNGGGFSGAATYYNGAFTQTKNAAVSALLDAPELLPAYRGQAHIVFEDCFVGEAPNLQALSFEVELQPNYLGVGPVGADGDANPAEILYDMLVNDWGRLGFSTGAMNGASFTAAGATLVAEGNGMSFKLENANDTRDASEEILKQIDGLIYEDPITREINLVLIRDDYDVGTLPIFDASNVKEIGSYKVTEWADTYNQIRVIYKDRASDYKEKTAFAQDMANIEFQGGKIRSMDFQYVGVSNATLANQIVARELNLNSIPLIAMRITANREAATLRPASVLLFSWPEYGISDLVMRVQKFDLGTLDDNRVVIDCIQDRFAISNTIFSPPPATDWSRPNVDALPAAPRFQIEAPRFLGLQVIGGDSNVAPDATADNSFVAYLEGRPNVLHNSFQAQASDDGGAEYVTEIETGTFAPTASLNAAVDRDTDEYIVGASPFVLKAVSDASILANITTEELEAGLNMLVIGDELIQFETFTDNLDGTYTLNNVSRGILDTSLRPHAEDDPVYFLSAGGLNVLGVNAFEGNEVLDLRVMTDTGFRRLSPDQAPVDALSLNQRPQRPYPPDGVTLDGVAYPATIETANYPITLDWLRRDRLQETVTRPDTADQAPEVGTIYRAKYSVNAGPITTVELGSGTTFDITFGTDSGTVSLEIHAEYNGLETSWPVLRDFTLIGAAPAGGEYDIDLYVGGFLGGLYRFKSAETYQDAALTTPVALNGDPVGGITDLTVPSNNMTQATAADQPVWDNLGDPNFGFATFDGSTDNLQTPVANLVPDQVEGAFAGRARIDLGATNDRAIIGGFQSSSSRNGWIGVDNGIPNFGIGNVTSWGGGGDIRSATDWHTIVGTYSSDGTVRLYLDGAEVNRKALTGQLSDVTSFVGARNFSDVAPNYFWDGDIAAALQIDRPLRIEEAHVLGTFWSPWTALSTQLYPIEADLLTAKDNSIHDATATFNGGATLDETESVFGFHSLRTAGTNDFVSIPNDGRFDIGNNDFDLGMWVMFDSDSTSLSFLAGQWNTSTNQRAWTLVRRGSTNKTQFLVSPNGSSTTTIFDHTHSVNLNQWYYFRVSFDGTTWRLYLDGVLLASNATSVTAFATTDDFVLGNRLNAGFHHDGWIGECVVFNGEAIQKSAGPEPLVGVLPSPIHLATANLTSATSTSAFCSKGVVFQNGSGSDLEIHNIRLRMGSVAGSGEVVVALTTGASQQITQILGRFPYDTTSFAGTDFLVPVREGGEPMIVPAGSDFVLVATRQDGVGTDSAGLRAISTPSLWENKLPAGVTEDGGFRSTDLDLQIGDTNASPSLSLWCVDFSGGLVA